MNVNASALNRWVRSLFPEVKPWNRKRALAFNYVRACLALREHTYSDGWLSPKKTRYGVIEYLATGGPRIQKNRAYEYFRLWESVGLIRLDDEGHVSFLLPASAVSEVRKENKGSGRAPLDIHVPIVSRTAELPVVVPSSATTPEEWRRDYSELEGEANWEGLTARELVHQRFGITPEEYVQQRYGVPLAEFKGAVDALKAREAA